MIIQGHPDILRGPQGLNGLHGFGSLPPQGSSPAYIRFLPEKGGAGIEALYQEIRDFINTPGRTEAEIQQAKMASGVSDEDVYNALANYEFPEVTDIFSPVITDDLAERSPYEPQPSAAYLRFLPENGGQGLDVLYKEIRAFLATNPTQAELEQAMLASGVSTTDLINSKDYAFEQQPPQEDYTFEKFCPPGSMLVDGVCVGDPSTYGPPIPESSLRNREIVDYVMTHSDAEILAQMAISNVTQSDIIQAFASFDPTMPNGQSPAYARSLPENGGGGIVNFYKEINDFVNTHSFYEVLSQMFRSEVSRADLEAANAYAFSQSPAGGGSGEADALAAAAEAAARATASNIINTVYHGDGSYTEYYGDGSYNTFGIPRATGVKTMEEAMAERAQEAADKAAGILSPEEKFNAEYQARIAQEAAREAESIRRQREAENYYWQKVREQREAEAAAAEMEARAAAAAAAAAKAAAEAEARRIAALREAERPVDETGRDAAYREELRREREAAAAEAVRREAAAAAAEATAQSVIAAQAAQAQQALEATLAARAAAAAAAAAQAVAAAAGDAASAATAAEAAAAAASAAASAATAAAIAVAKSPGQSAAYTRFLPENGGKGITALYKEISDFVAVSSNAEIKTAMNASGVSEVDVIKALEVFPNTVTTQPAKDTGLILPLVISAIAAFFVLG